MDADPARIEQILLILLDNALRHTPPGGRVEVAVGRDGGEATVAVRDTGEGIAPESQAFVFDRFYRGDAVARGPQRRPGARHRARAGRRAPGQHRAGVGGRRGQHVHAAAAGAPAGTAGRRAPRRPT